MNNAVVLGGESSLFTYIDGDMTLSQSVDADADLVYIKRESGFPIYDGPTTFTPGPEAQTVSTADRTMLSDIIIDPIPSNYGLITWNGSTITVS